MMSETLHRHFLFGFVLGGIVFLALVQAQDQSGFISLACGIEANTSYIESTTNLRYISDAGYIDTGISGSVEAQYKSTYLQSLHSVRSFPQGLRNCYTINVVKGMNYIIRASFLYGNYDGLKKVPVFDLYYGVNYWSTVDLGLESNSYYYEIIDAPSTDEIQICVVNTGQGTPFMAVIEIRPIKAKIYKPVSGSLELTYRYDAGSTNNVTYRYSYDIYDRLWEPYNAVGWTQPSTALTVDLNSHKIYELPSVITRTAATPRNASASLDYVWTPPNSSVGYYAYMHFAEVVNLQPNQTRCFNITLNGGLWYGPLIPEYLSSTTVESTKPITGSEEYTFSLIPCENSTLPPILNAFEVFTSVHYNNTETDDGDVGAMRSIKSTYKIMKNWQGDPCAPKKYTWVGVICDDEIPFRITSLILSSSGLKGAISPYITDIQMLQTLDLSNNSLTGTVPDFLSKLAFLKVLKLDKNNLTGSIPADLVNRAKSGLLTLSVSDNPNLDKCQLTSCSPSSPPPTAEKKGKTSVAIPVVASIIGVLVLAALIVAVLFFCKKKREGERTTNHQKDVDIFIEISHQSTPSNTTSLLSSSLEVKGRRFSYSEVVKMTNNFERILGEGGFGVVYHGFAGDIPVAVKILSTVSARGYRQFVAEVNLLMRVHHRNLTSLVGYLKEGTNVGLIYEYMVNGDLAEHLSENSVNFLSWEDRLRIAMDAALGLEYLHDGCKPPIIHRDVKTTNILLDDKFQAKLSDFGLSRDIPLDGSTHVATTTIAGTPGYVDPEYYLSNRLTEKSDIYSFGVVLLEMISCRAVITRSNKNAHINQWASSEFQQGDIRSIVDGRLERNYDVNSVWKAVEVALACVSVKPERRPPMSVVVNELKGCLAAELARKNQRGRPLDSIHSPEMLSVTVVSDSAVPVAR